MAKRSGHLREIPPSATAEEAAAIVAAIERFMHDTAPAPVASREPADRWRQAAILEGISREHEDDAPDPWINT
ncbi:MAG TPA: hypothetical protein VGN08_09550 [Solirubrobacteraceae bacterium]